MSGDPNAKVIFTEDNAHGSYCPSRQDGRPVFHNPVPRDAGCRRGKKKRKVKMPLRIWPTDFGLKCDSKLQECETRQIKKINE